MIVNLKLSHGGFQISIYNYAKIKKITGAVYEKNESVWKL